MQNKHQKIFVVGVPTSREGGGGGGGKAGWDKIQSLSKEINLGLPLLPSQPPSPSLRSTMPAIQKYQN